MHMRRPTRNTIFPCLKRSTALLALSAAVGSAPAQRITLPDSPDASTTHPQRVSLDSESFDVVAGKQSWVELRFHVAPGLHINSHTPHDELLIATALKIDPSKQYRVLKAEYPAGEPLHLSIGGGETLSAYQGEFRIRLAIDAKKGDAVLTGTLHYQACDSASCFPPRDLPVRLALSAH